MFFRLVVILKDDYKFTSYITDDVMERRLYGIYTKASVNTNITQAVTLEAQARRFRVSLSFSSPYIVYLHALHNACVQLSRSPKGNRRFRAATRSSVSERWPGDRPLRNRAPPPRIGRQKLFAPVMLLLHISIAISFLASIDRPPFLSLFCGRALDDMFIVIRSLSI